MTRGNQRDTDRLRAQQRAAGGAGTGKSTLGTAESTAAIMRAKQEAAMAKKAAEAAGKQPENGQVVGLKAKQAPTSEADGDAHAIPQRRVGVELHAEEALCLLDEELWRPDADPRP